MRRSRARAGSSRFREPTPSGWSAWARRRRCWRRRRSTSSVGWVHHPRLAALRPCDPAPPPPWIHPALRGAGREAPAPVLVPVLVPVRKRDLVRCAGRAGWRCRRRAQSGRHLRGRHIALISSKRLRGRWATATADYSCACCFSAVLRVRSFRTGAAAAISRARRPRSLSRAGTGADNGAGWLAVLVVSGFATSKLKDFAGCRVCASVHPSCGAP